MILPLVIASLIAGSASLNARMNGRIALRTLIYFASTSFFNSILGICLVVLIHPGQPGLHTELETVGTRKAVNLLDSLLDLGRLASHKKNNLYVLKLTNLFFRNILPDNIFQAAFQQAHTVYVPKVNPFQYNDTLNTSDSDAGEPEMVRVLQYRAGTNTLGIVFFCLVFGTLLGTIGEKGHVVVDFFTAVFEVVMKMVTGVMWLTPIGISSVIAGRILEVDNLGLVMSQLVLFICTVAVGVFFYQLVVLQLIYFIFLGRNPFKFYCGLIQPMLTAFATAST
jgi:solute carrier family 1 (glial high affinity glutamate transporter), member 2